MILQSVTATDFCVLKKAKVRLANRGLVFICAENRDTNGADSNGSGKTTIFKAVTWCLFGECVDGDKGDEVIRAGRKKAVVTTKIKDAATMWHVTRTRTKGKPKLEVFRTLPGSETAELVSGDKKELQELIHKLVGLDFKAFTNTVLYGANDHNKFADPRTKDMDRKRMLHSILRTSSLAASHRKALDRLKTVKSSIESIDVRLGRVKTALNTIDLPEMKNRVSEWKRENAAEVSLCLRKATDLKNRASELRAVDHSPAVKQAKIAYRGAMKKRDASVKAGDEIKEAIARMDESRGKMEGLRREMDRLEDHVTAVEKSMEKLKGDVCPTCHGDLTTGAPEKHIKNNARRCETSRDAIERLKAEGVKEKAVYLSAKAEKDKSIQSMSETRQLIADATSAEAEVKKAERKAREAAQRVSDIIAEARTFADNARKLGVQNNPHAEAHDAAIVKVQGLKAKRKKLKSDRVDEETFLAYVEWWVKGFSNKGLPSYILDSSMPRITKAANRHLRVLSDGDITMDFQTQRFLKSDKAQVRDDIDITTTIEGCEGRKPSSGQLTKMNFATGLALMDIASEKEGNHLDLLMIDEVLDGLDGEGTERVLALLQKLRKKHSSIFVISHGTAMSEIFEHGLKVIKEDGSAKVRTIA